MSWKRSFSVLLILLFMTSVCLAWSGKVVGISDGDTITVLKGTTPFKIRLYGIDCPERGQAFGKRAKQFTSDMVFLKHVKIEPVDKDRYGRLVACVFVDGGKSV
jgi:micrococcal nuclease